MHEKLVAIREAKLLLRFFGIRGRGASLVNLFEIFVKNLADSGGTGSDLTSDSGASGWGTSEAIAGVRGKHLRAFHREF